MQAILLYLDQHYRRHHGKTPPKYPKFHHRILDHQILMWHNTAVLVDLLHLYILVLVPHYSITYGQVFLLPGETRPILHGSTFGCI